MGFYRWNDPTNSVKALKEDNFLTIRLQSHWVHLTMFQLHNTYSAEKTDDRNMFERKRLNISTVQLHSSGTHLFLIIHIV